MAREGVTEEQAADARRLLLDVMEAADAVSWSVGWLWRDDDTVSTRQRAREAVRDAEALSVAVGRLRAELATLAGGGS